MRNLKDIIIERLVLTKHKKEDIFSTLEPSPDGCYALFVVQKVLIEYENKTGKSYDLSNIYDEAAIAVDTHVSRVSKRLNICDESDSVTIIEKKLTNKFPKKEWSLLHLRMVLFGRYICKAIKPECSSCPFKGKCNYTK